MTILSSEKRSFSTAPRLVVGIDPGSSRTGICLFESGELSLWSVLRTPSKFHGIDAAMFISESVGSWLETTIGKENPVAIFLEVPGKQVGRNAGAGLITLGMAIGGIAAKGKAFGALHPIEVREWIRFGGFQLRDKETRASLIRERFPEYASGWEDGLDPGLDGADAIGLIASTFGIISLASDRPKPKAKAKSK